MPVKLTVAGEKVRYPLHFDDLKAGYFYEHEYGTIVFVGREELNNNNPINVENGLGGYKSSDGGFRSLPPNTTITITTDKNGIVG